MTYETLDQSDEGTCEDQIKDSDKEKELCDLTDHTSDTREQQSQHSYDHIVTL